MIKANIMLIALDYKNKGDWDSIYEDIKNKNTLSEDSEYIEFAKEHEKEYVTIVDNDYPPELKNFYKPRFVYKRSDLVKKTYEVKIIRTFFVETYNENLAKQLAIDEDDLACEGDVEVESKLILDL